MAGGRAGRATAIGRVAADLHCHWRSKTRLAISVALAVASHTAIPAAYLKVTRPGSAFTSLALCCMLDRCAAKADIRLRRDDERESDD